MTEQTTEPVVEPVEPTSDAAPETEAPAEATLEAKAPEQPAAAPDPEPTPEPEVAAPDTEPTPEVADRVIPAIDDYVLPEGIPIDVAKFAYANDMTQEQLDSTLKEFAGYSQQAEVGKQAIMRKDGEALVESWGKQKNYNLSVVTRAVEQNDPDGTLSAFLKETGYGNHPAVIGFFLNIGNSMREGGFLKGSVNTPRGTQSTAASAMFGNTHPVNN